MNYKDFSPTYIAEFVGTFALVFCGTAAIVVYELVPNSLDNTGIGIVFGLVVFAMILCFGNISGAHINPAVTIGFWAMKKISLKESVYYILFQLLGAIVASLLVGLIFGSDHSFGNTLPKFSIVQSFVLEIILTYILMLVIVFVSEDESFNRLTAAAVGGTVMLEAIFAGPISGASMNPARSLAPSLVSGNMEVLWIYILAPIIGALLAVATWRFMESAKKHLTEDIT